MGEQRQHKPAVIAGQHLRIFVIALADEPAELILLAGEGEGVGLNLGRHKGLNRLAIFFKNGMRPSLSYKFSIALRA